jgi:hypothetical protein
VLPHRWRSDHGSSFAHLPLKGFLLFGVPNLLSVRAFLPFSCCEQDNSLTDTAVVTQVYLILKSDLAEGAALSVSNSVDFSLLELRRRVVMWLPP